MSVPVDFLLDGTVPSYEWKDLYAYVSVYGIHIVIGALLSAVTIYRREMSCNRVFHEDEEEDSSTTTTEGEGGRTNSNAAEGEESVPAVLDEATLLRISEKLEAETDELLEGAGMYCSAQPIVSLLYTLWLGGYFQILDGEGNKQDGSNIDNDNHRSNNVKNNHFYHYQEGEPHLHSNFLRGQEHVSSSDLLEHAWNYCSGEPLLTAMALFLLHKSKFFGISSHLP